MYIFTYMNMGDIWIQVRVGKIKVKSYQCIPFLKFWIDEYTILSPGCSPFCHFDKNIYLVEQWFHYWKSAKNWKFHRCVWIHNLQAILCTNYVKMDYQNDRWVFTVAFFRSLSGGPLLGGGFFRVLSLTP